MERPAMNDESDEKWLRERMQKMRATRDASAPAFEQVWRDARARTTPQQRIAFPAWRLAWASAAVLVVLATSITWSSMQRERNRRMERDFAEVEGTLLTYWQAPSDTLFPTAGGNEAPER